MTATSRAQSSRLNIQLFDFAAPPTAPPPRRLYFLGSVDDQPHATQKNIATGTRREVHTFPRHPHFISRALSALPEATALLPNEDGVTDTTILWAICLFTGTVSAGSHGQPHLEKGEDKAEVEQRVGIPDHPIGMLVRMVTSFIVTPGLWS